MDPSAGSGERSTRALRWWMVPIGVVAALIATGWAVDWLNTLPAEEGKVLETFLAEAFAQEGYDLRIVQSVDLTPCWWYCEYLEVNARAELEFDPSATPAERCERVTSRLAQLTDVEPRELEDRVDNRACWRSWRFLRNGRILSISIDVSEESGRPVEIYIRNNSATRAFLPQG